MCHAPTSHLHLFDNLLSPLLGHSGLLQWRINVSSMIQELGHLSTFWYWYSDENPSIFWSCTMIMRSAAVAFWQLLTFPTSFPDRGNARGPVLSAIRLIKGKIMQIMAPNYGYKTVYRFPALFMLSTGYCSKCRNDSSFLCWADCTLLLGFIFLALRDWVFHENAEKIPVFWVALIAP